VKNNLPRLSIYILLLLIAGLGMIAKVSPTAAQNKNVPATGEPQRNRPSSQPQTPSRSQPGQSNVLSPQIPCPGAYKVLIVFADGGVPPNTLRNNLLAEPGIASVDLFDGQTGTPSLAQLQQYDIVVPFSNFGWSDQTTLGNNLGSYLAAGGIVVAFNFDWFGGRGSILGTWVTTYTPFNNPGATNFSNGSLGTCTFAPLCTGVTTLNAFYREIATLAGGASLAATWNDATPLVAYKGRAVGVNAYVGDFADNFSGDYARVIANAGRFLSPPNCGCTLTINCPANITTFTDSGKSTATVNPGAPSTADSCGSPTVKGVRNDGKALTDPYPVGATIITWTATDSAHGTSANCMQTITVSVPGGGGYRSGPVGPRRRRIP
jgi:hypothetical protein